MIGAGHSGAPADGAGTARGGWLAVLPLGLGGALFAFLMLSRVQQNDHLWWSFTGVATALVAWYGVLWLRARGGGGALLVTPIRPVRQHYIQAMVQLVLYAYWGYLWVADGARPMYLQAPLIVAQLCYVFAFDALWSWTRGRVWRLASGPAPIVLSTNLFIWFRDDWFVWQFAMITAGLLGKEFIRWQKDGRRTHVFNPSGFGLMCAATVLIVTGTTDLTWAKPLATTIEVPHIFVVLFLLGLVVQHFFAVTLMTFAAALAMVAVNLAYTWTTGVYLFGSTNLPAAAFLGLMLLMTDPSTSPRSNVGRALFGAGYGLGYVLVFEVLGHLGAPELYAKLYPVPVLNTCVQWLDRLAHSGWLGRLNTRWEQGLPARVTNALHMVLWSGVFLTMFWSGYVEAPHPGDSIAFWKRAVEEGRFDAERGLVRVVGSKAIGMGSAAAYNELGILSLTGGIDAADPATRHKSAANWWSQAARRGSDEASCNIVMHFLYDGLRVSDAELGHAFQRLDVLARESGGNRVRARQLLGLAHETGAGVPPSPANAQQLYAGCGDDVFAKKGLVRLALAGTAVDVAGMAPLLAAATAAGDGEAAFYLAHLHALGRGVPRDPQRASELLQRAAEAGFEAAPRAGDAAPLPPFAPPSRKQMHRPPWVTAFPLQG